MSSATKLVPRFGLGDWVSFLVGFRKVLAQVVEDRGLVGIQGRRVYLLQIDQSEDGGTAIEVPEADLEPAPAITTAELARENGLSTQNWPRRAFDVTYKRPQDANVWTGSLKPVASWAVPPMVRGPRGLGYAGSVNLEIVRVDLEYDPRLADPQTSPVIWTSLTENARRIADAVFKAKHPKARVIHEPAVHSKWDRRAVAFLSINQASSPFYVESELWIDGFRGVMQKTPGSWWQGPAAEKGQAEHRRAAFDLKDKLMSDKGRTAAIEILRKEVGFGCPICRNPLLTWHHFAPPSNVEHHWRPEGMIALCLEHDMETGT
jgi:hypothetical protein